MGTELQAILLAGLNQLDLTLSEKNQKQLIDYVQLLHQWNQTQNLTAIASPKAMMDRHILDSLALVAHIHENHCLDVGSGAGLPGLPLAIACPKKTLFLLEARLKRVVFLRHCVATLALPNVVVLHTRLEDYSPEPGHAAVVARAFCPPKDYLKRVGHVLAPQGCAYLQVGEQTKQADLQQGEWRDLEGTRGGLWIVKST